MLIARDAAPSQVLERVRTELQVRGHRVGAILGHGKPLGDFSETSIYSLVLTSDLVLAGMSSTEELSKEEILAVKVAADNNIPYGFVCDLFDGFKPPWFADFRAKASKIFVVIEGEIAEAKGLFPNAEVIASGNPCWEDFFDTLGPEEKEALRSRLGLVPNRKTILAAGGKDLMINMTFFGGVVSAVNAIERNRKFLERVDKITSPEFQVILSIHPGDSSDVSIYKSFMQNQHGGLSRVPVAIDRGTKPEKLLSISDVVVVLGSNTGIAAACQRKPVINYFTELYRNYIEAGGGWPWKPCSELGIAEFVTDVDHRARLDDMILWLAHPGDSWRIRSMLSNQKRVFPAPQEKGVAVRKICDALGALAVHQ